MTSERAAIKKHFVEYLKHGGMPEYLKYHDATLLKRLYEDILYRDIVARYGIKQIKPLRELGLYLLSNIGGTVLLSVLYQFLRRIVFDRTSEKERRRQHGFSRWI